MLGWLQLILAVSWEFLQPLWFPVSHQLWQWSGWGMRVPQSSFMARFVCFWFTFTGPLVYKYPKSTALILPQRLCIIFWFSRFFLKPRFLKWHLISDINDNFQSVLFPSLVHLFDDFPSTSTRGIKDTRTKELNTELSESIWDKCLSKIASCPVKSRHQLIQDENVHVCLITNTNGYLWMLTSLDQCGIHWIWGYEQPRDLYRGNGNPHHPLR